MPPTAKSSPAPAARATKQERSRETLERILVAAEELLETREFDELTMAELARHADCAVGTVYGRVPNKESLLLCLHERYMHAGMGAFARMVERCRDAGLDERVRALCALVVDFHGTHRGVTRAVTNYLFARPSADVSDNVAIFRRETTAGFKQAASFLAEKVDSGIHSDAQAASEFALLAANDVAQRQMAFGDRSGVRIDYSPRALKARMTALLLAYLRHG